MTDQLPDWMRRIEDSLLPFQKNVRQFLMTRPAAAAWVGMGGGKLAALDSLVLTPTGFIRMGDVRVGQQIVTPCGDIAPVIGVYPQGERDLYRLTLSDGRTAEAGAEHLWVVSTFGQRHRGTAPRVKSTAELIDDLTCRNGDSKWSIEAVSPVDLGTWSSTMDPYLLGAVLGDGCITRSSIGFTNPDVGVLTEVRRLLPASLELKPSSSKNPNGLNWCITKADMSSPGAPNPLTQELRRLGLWGHRAESKFVPAQLLNSSVADRLALVHGLLDTNGTAKRSGFDFTVKSEQLAKDLCWLVRSLGGYASLNPRVLKSGPYAGNLYRRVTGRLRPGTPAFRAAADKLAKVRPLYDGTRDGTGPIQLAIRSIEYSRTAQAQCIAVGHPSRQYVMDEFVRTHNTVTTLSALSCLREPGHILVVAPRNIAVDTWPQELADWDIPLPVTSLNITPPGMLDKRRRPLKGQRNLKPQEFSRIVDSVPAAPAQLYTVGNDRLVALVQRIVYGGPPRTRLVGEPSPTGEPDLDMVRDRFERIVAVFGEIAESAGMDPELAKLLAKCQVIGLRPATAGGLPPTAVIGHPDPNKAALLRSPDHLAAIAQAVEQCLDRPMRAAVQISRADPSLWPFPTVILDESQAFKDPKSGRFRAMALVRPYIRRVIELSGTPSPEGPHEIWPQMYLLDQGRALGPSYQQHLEDLFLPDQMVNGQVTRWKISPANEKLLHSQVSHLAISAENNDLRLPGYAPEQVHRVRLDPKMMQAYKSFRKDSLITVLTTGLDELKEQARQQALDDGLDETAAQLAADAVVLDPATAHQIEAANGGVLHGKSMQFAAGAVYLEMDSSHPDYAAATEFTKTPILRLHDGKLDAVEEILDRHFSVPDPGSVLVAYKFEFEKQLLLRRLHASGHARARAFNGMPDTVRAWNRGEIPVMLLHPASAGHGLNLQYGGSTLIWLSLPDSNEHFRQTPARLNRVGQRRPVQVHIVVTAGTLDERQPTVLSGKQGSQNRLLIAARKEFADVFDDAVRAAT